MDLSFHFGSLNEPFGGDSFRSNAQQSESRHMTERPHGRQAEVTQRPPAHLAGALQAAAAARALAERIRNRDASLKSAHERREPEKSETIPLEPRPSRPSRGGSPRPSFARTIEAVKLASPSTSDNNGELVPWHLSLRAEVNGGRWPRRWLARVFKRGVARRESAAVASHSPADGASSVARATRTADRSATVAAAGSAPDGAANGGPPAGIARPPVRDRGVPRFNPQPAESRQEREAGPDGVARLPSLRARELRWDEVSSRAAQQSRGCGQAVA